MVERLTRARTAIACAVVLAVLVPGGAALAVGEGQPVEGGERNPTSDANQAYTRETEIIATTETYGTRQSNKRSGDGGGAIYGCRSNPGNEPCIRSNNLEGGRAFEFDTTGREGGRIEVGDTAGSPFTTNATGVATGLNADRVDGRDGEDLDDARTLDGRTPASFAAAGDLLFAAVSDAGTLRGGRGATTASESGATTTVSFDRDVSRCSYTASPLGETATRFALAVSGGPNASQVRVHKGEDEDPDFHLQVIC